MNRKKNNYFSTPPKKSVNSIYFHARSKMQWISSISTKHRYIATEQKQWKTVQITIVDHVDHPSFGWYRTGLACSLQFGRFSCWHGRAHGWQPGHLVLGSSAWYRLELES